MSLIELRTELESLRKKIMEVKESIRNQVKAERQLVRDNKKAEREQMKADKKAQREIAKVAKQVEREQIKLEKQQAKLLKAQEPKAPRKKVVKTVEPVVDNATTNEFVSLDVQGPSEETKETYEDMPPLEQAPKVLAPEDKNKQVIRSLFTKPIIDRPSDCESEEEEQPETPEWKRIQNLKLRQIRYQDGLEEDSETESIKVIDNSSTELLEVNENFKVEETTTNEFVPLDVQSPSEETKDTYEDMPTPEQAPAVVTKVDRTSIDQYNQFKRICENITYFKRIPTFPQYLSGIKEVNQLYMFNIIMDDVEKHCKVPNKNHQINFKQYEELNRLNFSQDETPYLICLRDIFEQEPDFKEQQAYEKFQKDIKSLKCYNPKYIMCKKMFLTNQYCFPHVVKDAYNEYVETRMLIEKYVPNWDAKLLNTIDSLSSDDLRKILNYQHRTDISEIQKESAVINLIVNEDRRHPDVKSLMTGI